MASDTFVGTLSEACERIDYGLTASATDDTDATRFLRITDIVGAGIDWSTVPGVKVSVSDREKYRLNDGDIVLARTGASTGASAYVQDPPEAVFASYLVRLTTKANFDSRYVSYWLRSDAFLDYIRGVIGDKSAQPNASASTMTNAPFSAPELEEQRRIAHILGTLDDKIELNRRMSETLEEMARALFKSWFVDFDPVRAKAEGRDTGLPPHIADLFPDRLVESELGPIPDSWNWVELGEIVDEHRRTVNPERLAGTAVAHYSLPAFDRERLPEWTDASTIKSSKTRLHSESVLVSRLNPRTPRIWRVNPGNDYPALASTEFAVLEPKDEKSMDWLHFLLQSDVFLAELRRRVTGTSGSHQRVNRQSLLAIPTVEPPAQLRAGFGEFAGPWVRQALRLRDESQLLSKTRDVLLHELVG